MKRWFLILCSLLLLAGCYSHRVRVDFAPLSPGAVASEPTSEVVLLTGDLDRPYEEIGIIFVRGRHVSHEKVMEKMRAKAQEVGATAVVRIECGQKYWSFRRPYCRGVAVK